MNIVFISKRRPQQRCLIARPYGRFYHLPIELARLGHKVDVILIGHSGDMPEEIHTNNVTWHTLDFKTNTFHLPNTCFKIASACNPSWVVGFSDAWTGCIADYIANRTKAKLAIDAYDDYESYMPWNFPLHFLWRKTIHHAQLCTAAGPQLAQIMNRYRTGKNKTEIVPMAADPNFIPMNKESCRSALNLPADKMLIGYAGGWASKRGTDLLIDAFRNLRQREPNAILVLTGNPPKHLFNEAGIKILGYLQDSEMPLFINALDVSAVITADTGFGRSSYPVKLYEAMSCKVPIVATASEPVRWMLDMAKPHLSPLGDSTAFADAILKQLHSPEIHYPPQNTWQISASKFNQLLYSI